MGLQIKLLLYVIVHLGDIEISLPPDFSANIVEALPHWKIHRYITKAPIRLVFDFVEQAVTQLMPRPGKQTTIEVEFLHLTEGMELCSAA